QKKVSHSVYCGFTFAHSYSFYQNHIKTCSFTQNNTFSRFAGNSSQRISGWGGTNKGIILFYQTFHSGFVAQNASSGNRTAGIYGQDGYFFAFGQKVFSITFDESTFPDSRHTGNSNSEGISGMR